MHSDSNIPNNQLDIKIRDNEKGTCLSIDVAISGDRTAIKKEAEKLLKYKGLKVEIQSMWNVKERVTPVITGATGTISKSFRQYPSKISGKHATKEFKKNKRAILDTEHLLRKLLP